MEFEEIISKPLNETDFSIIDVETTGLRARENKIIEIGIVRVSKMKIAKKFHSLINPGREIPYFITQFTGISNADVYDAPFFDEIARDILNFITDSVIAAHNISFDLSFLKHEFSSCEVEFPQHPKVCTMRTAKKLYPLLRSASLRSVISHLRLKNKNSHRALSDAEATAKALIKMMRELKKTHGLKTTEELINFQFQSGNTDKPKSFKKKLAKDLTSLPNSPGIYYFINSKNEIIYVGKAKSLKERVKSHFLSTAPVKSKKIIKQASRLKIESTNTEVTALLAEAELIKLLNPKHNKQLKKYGHKYFIKLTISHPYPAVTLTPHFAFDGDDYFGPFTSRDRAAALQGLIDNAFQLRECTNTEFLKGKACFLSEIERCTAPCENKNKYIYSEELKRVYEFLSGKSQTALNRLLSQMKSFSEKQKYEMAAEKKRIIDTLLLQIHKSSLLSEPINTANVLFEVREGRKKDFLLMLKGKIHIKKYFLKEKDYFDEALDDYFDNTLNINFMPCEEDLEKVKIMLNWMVSHRNEVRIFYLKDFSTKQDLYSKISQFNSAPSEITEAAFDLKNLLNLLSVEIKKG